MTVVQESVGATTESMGKLTLDDTEIINTLRLDEVVEIFDHFIVEKKLDPRHIHTLINLAYQINGGHTIGELLGYQNQFGMPVGVHPECLLYSEKSIHRLIHDAGKKVDEIRKHQAEQTKQAESVKQSNQTKQTEQIKHTKQGHQKKHAKH